MHRPFVRDETVVIATVAISILPIDSDAGYFSRVGNGW
jgi:hypothetical protein